MVNYEAAASLKHNKVITPCLRWDLAQIFDILRNFKAKNVKKLRKLHLKFERS